MSDHAEIIETAKHTVAAVSGYYSPSMVQLAEAVLAMSEDNAALEDVIQEAHGYLTKRVADNAALLAALEKYGQHLNNVDILCEVVAHPDNDCTCGLDAAKEAKP